MSTIINATTTNGVVIQPDNSGSLVLQTNSGTTALTISTAQNATFASQATIPTINLTGGQIAFPATQSASANANTLDDYEEGTWTPTATDFSINTGWTGTYTKIGRLVYLTVRNTTAITSTKLTSIITGLPFLPATNSSLTATSDTNVNDLGGNLVDDGGTNGRIFPQSWTSSGTPYISAIYITNT
jgi:hypothetical protein